MTSISFSNIFNSSRTGTQSASGRSLTQQSNSLGLGASLSSTSSNAETLQLTAALKNVNGGISVLSLASSGLSSLSSVLTQQRMLATLTTSRTLSTAQRNALQAESDALTVQFNDILGATSLTGQEIFGSALSLATGDSAEFNISIGDSLQAINSAAATETSQTRETGAQVATTGTVADVVSGSQGIADDISTAQNLADSIGSTQNVSDSISTNQNLSENVSGTQNLTDGVSSNQTVTDSVTANQDLTEGTTGSQNLGDTVSTDQNITDTSTATQNVTGGTTSTTNVTDSVTANQDIASTGTGEDAGGGGSGAVVVLDSVASNVTLSQDPTSILGGSSVQANATTVGGNMVDGTFGSSTGFTADTGVNVATDTITVGSTSGFSTGDLVRIGGSNNPGGISNGINYYLIKVDGTHIQLATSLTNANNGTAIDITSTGTGAGAIVHFSSDVNTSSDTLTLASHGFLTGQAVQVYQNLSGQTTPGGLADNATYYAIVTDSGHLKLATSLSNAQSGIAVDITTIGSAGFRLYGLYTPNVDLSSDAITINSHGLSTGQKVQVSATGSGTGVTALAGGLSANTDYYIIASDSNHLKFATSLSNAQNGSAIDLTQYGSGNLVVTPYVTSSQINTSTDSLNLVAHGFTTGERIRVSSDGTLSGGLSANTDYYAIAIDSNHIKLADSLAHANAGTAIDITSTGSGTLTATGYATDINAATDILHAASHGFSTGDRVTVSSSATISGGLSPATSYYVIATDSDHFKLATSLTNATNGTAINITSQGTGELTVGLISFSDLTGVTQDDATYQDIAGVSGTSQQISSRLTINGANDANSDYEYQNMSGHITPGDYAYYSNASGGQYRVVFSIGGDDGGYDPSSDDQYGVQHTEISLNSDSSDSDIASAVESAFQGFGISGVDELSFNDTSSTSFSIDTRNYQDVNPNDDTIHSVNNGLSTGDAIAFNSGDGSGTGLNGNTTYYAISVDSDHFKVAASQSDAQNGIAIDLSAGYGQVTFDVAGSAPQIDTSGDTVTDVNHGYSTGQHVQVSTSGSLAGGLSANTDYYIIAQDSDHIKFAISATDAQNGIAVDLTSSGSGALTVTTYDPDVNAASDTIGLGSHGLATGDRVRVSSDGTLAGGLSANTDYYAIVTDADHIKLTASRQDALKGQGVINITSTGSGTQTVASYSTDVTQNAVEVAETPQVLSIPPTTVEGGSTSEGIGEDYTGFDGSHLFAGAFSQRTLFGETYTVGINLDGNDNGFSGIIGQFAHAIEINASSADSDQDVANEFHAAYLSMVSADHVDDNSSGLSIDIQYTRKNDIDESTDSFHDVGHGYSTGDAVTLSGAGVPGGISENTTYYVIAQGPDHLQLAASQSDAMNGIQIDLTDSGFGSITINPQGEAPAINTATDTITTSQNAFTSGQKVQVSSSGGLPGGVSSNTDYFIISTDSTHVKLATSLSNAINGTAVNITSGAGAALTFTPYGPDVDTPTDIIHLASHGLTTGDRIKVDSPGTLAGGLSDSTSYYAIVTDANHIKVATSFGNAQAGTAVDLTSTGTGTLNVSSFPSENNVNVNNNAVAIASHGLSTGDLVQVSSDGVLSGGLSANTYYYAIASDSDHVKFATSLANANAGTAIDITSQGSGILTVSKLNTGGGGGGGTGVDASGDTFSLTAHGISTGQIVRVSSSGALAGGLSADTDYYAIAVDADHIKFATSYANAQANTAIDVTDNGTGTQTVTKYTPDVNTATDAVHIASHGLSTGERVRIASSGTLSGGLSANTDYYVIASDSDHLKFATSYANAQAGTAVDITSTGSGTLTVTNYRTDVDTAADTIHAASHGLTAGQLVHVSSTGSLAGGLSANTDYYVIASDADHIKLATSFANAQAGTAIDITSKGTGTLTISGIGGDVDTSADTAQISSHGLVTGQRLRVSSSGTLAGGLAAATDYYAIVTDANRIKFATSYANAQAGTGIDLTSGGTGIITVSNYSTDVDTSTDALHLASHGLVDGQTVRVSSTGSPAGGLSAATDYYVKVVDGDHIQLSATQGGAAINLTTKGTGTLTVSAYTPDVDASTEKIHLASHGLVTGQKVRVSSTNTLAGGLAAATDYYVIASDSDHIKLATSLANANAGTAIDLTSAGTGTLTVTAYGADVDVTQNSLHLASHGIVTGQRVRVSSSNTLAGGLSVNTDYYAIKVDNDHIKFATSLANANAGTAIDITSTGTGTLTVTNYSSNVDTLTEQINIASHGFVTGQRVQVSSDNTLAGGLSASTDYYVIKDDNNHIRLATSLANANAGTAVDLTSSGTGTLTVTGYNQDVDTTTEKIHLTSHGLVTGQKVQVSSTNTLAGGLSANTDYYVIASDSDHIKLATSLANANAGTAIDLTSAGTGVLTVTAYGSAVDTAADTINATTHGIVTGQRVRVSSTNTLAGGLSANTDYYAIATDGDHIKLATSLNNANGGIAIDLTSSGTGTLTVASYTPDVDTSQDKVHSIAHGLVTGQRVRVAGGNTLAGGLSANTDYYVIASDADHFKLATSQANALAGTGIDLTSAGTGPLAVTAYTPDVDATTNKIDITSHGLVTGQRVRVSTGNTLAGGLATNTDYYVINDDNNHIRLATSQVNALAGTAIDITSAGTGNLTVTGYTPDVDVAANSIHAASHGLVTGQHVRVSSSNTLAGGLSAATDYYAIVTDGNHVKLATSLANAQAGTAIDLTTAGTGTLTVTNYLPDVDVSQNKIHLASHGLTTGQIVRIGSNGNVPAGLQANTNYYVIASDADHIKLATSDANAQAGTGIDITSAGIGPITLTGYKPDINTATDALHFSAHGLTTGQRVRVSSEGTLAGGLSANTDYYAIIVDADHIKFATSAANAQAGIAVDVTSEGIGKLSLTSYKEGLPANTTGIALARFDLSTPESSQRAIDAIDNILSVAISKETANIDSLSDGLGSVVGRLSRKRLSADEAFRQLLTLDDAEETAGQIKNQIRHNVVDAVLAHGKLDIENALKLISDR
jgi:hypothetical protein